MMNFIYLNMIPMDTTYGKCFSLADNPEDRPGATGGPPRRPDAPVISWHHGSHLHTHLVHPGRPKVDFYALSSNNCLRGRFTASGSATTANAVGQKIIPSPAGGFSTYDRRRKGTTREGGDD